MEAPVKNKRFDFVGLIVSPLIIMLMELCWVYPWLVWSRELDRFPWTTDPINIFYLLLLIIIAYGVTRFIPASTGAARVGKIVIIVLAIGGVISVQYGGGFIPLSHDWLVHMGRTIVDSFSTLHPIIPAITASMYMSWRGAAIGGNSSGTNDVFRSFLIEFVMVIILIIVWSASIGNAEGKSLVSQAGVYIAGFFFFGLIALAMGNFLSIRQKLILKNSVPLSNRRWFTILMAVIGGMVVIGIGLASLFSVNFLDNSTSLFGRIVYRVNYVVEWIFNLLSWFVEFIWAIMTWLINLVRAKEPAEFESPGIDEIKGLDPNSPMMGNGFDPMIIVKWAIFILVIALVIYLIYRASRRYQAKNGSSGIEEFSESLWSWLGFRSDIGLFFSRLFDRWFGSKIRNLRSNLTATRPKKQEAFPDDMNIREIYRNVLTQASQSGHSRRSHETPYEYARRLDSSIPDITEQVDGITDMYVQVRYGENQMKDWETEHANVLFRLLHRILRKPDKNQK